LPSLFEDGSLDLALDRAMQWRWNLVVIYGSGVQVRLKTSATHKSLQAHLDVFPEISQRPAVIIVLRPSRSDGNDLARQVKTPRHRFLRKMLDPLNGRRLDAPTLSTIIVIEV
jgi:hypothetical protein